MCLRTSRLFIQMQGQKMFVLSFTLFLCILFFSDASYVDNISKCSIKDDQCMLHEFQKLLPEIAAGVAELNIPPIDPMKITNVSFIVFDSIELTITDGSVKGLKNCVAKKFNLYLDKHFGSQDLACDVLSMKGQFLLGGSSPMLQSLIGSTKVQGHGKVKLKLEKVTMSLDLPVAVYKKEEGDTHLTISHDKPKYKYNIEQATFDIKSLVIGKNDMSQVASLYLNSNWKSVMKTFGKVFIDKAMEFLVSFAQAFFDSVPTKVFIEEDLTPFVSN